MIIAWRTGWLLLVGLLVAGAGCSSPSAEQPGNVAEGQGALRGAGATFPAPLYEKWIEEYAQLRPEVKIQYDSVGSGAGIEQFMAGQVDFGASDAAMTDEQMAEVKRGVQLVPMTAGSIALAYHLPGVDELRLPRDVYVDIFLGKIKNWRDARIAAANPQLHLPDLSIYVVARQDSSGTTYAFTNHLSAISPAWREFGPKVGKVIDWPGGAMLANGNDGVAARIKRTEGAIGYVEYGVGYRLGLTMASLENKAGQFVSPSGDSGLATLAATTLPENLRAFFPDPPGDASYPIVTYTWLLLYKQYDQAERKQALQEFVRWCLTTGQQYNEPLGFIRLAPPVVAATEAAIDEL